MNDPTQANDSVIRLIDAEDESDLNDARRLFRSYAAEFVHFLEQSLATQGFDAELASLPGRYAPPGGCLLLAREGDKPAAGCVALRDLGGGTCEMKRLYVDMAYRSRGVGRLLIEAILQRAEDLGYRRIVLDTLPEMTGALKLYRSLGFVEIEAYWENPVERTIYLEKALTQKA